MTAFNWWEFIVFAEALVADDASTEGAHRSAVSRGYYAVFNLARAYVVAESRIDPTWHESYDQVWQALEAGSRAERRVGQAGKRLRYWRNWADYEESYPQVARDSADLVAMARRVTDEIDRLPRRAER